MMSKQAQYAWAAGFTDGEGCISIQRQKGYFCVRFHLVQKAAEPLEFFRKVFELTESLHTVTRKDRRHPYYRLTVSGKRAAEILRLMLPHLTLKREVAEVAIELSDAMESLSAKERSAGISDTERARRQALYEQARWFNSGRWAAATTKPSGPARGCDSLDCTDEKGAEVAETTTRLQ